MPDEVPPPAAMRGSADAVEIAKTVLAVLDGSRPGPAAMATVVQRAGSAPQATGAKMLRFADGTIVGTVGGGAIEAQVLEACAETLRDGRARMVSAHLVRDLAMCCGGSMEVFVEYLQAQTRLFIVGGGHVAQAVAPLAVSAGFRVSVFDDREEILGHPAFEGLTTDAYDVDELDAAIPDLSDADYLLIVTRDHARDEKALAALLQRPHQYIGMIGSRRKVHTVVGRVLRREAQMGRPAPDLSRLRAPVGLALGGKTPPEIAVSIVAELLAWRHGGAGTPMSIVDDVAPAVDD